MRKMKNYLKTGIVLIGLVITYFHAFSQVPDNLYAGDRDGRVIIAMDVRIKGSEFYFDAWNNGMLVMNDSVFSFQTAINYDALNDCVFIKRNDLQGKLFEINDNSITGFSVGDGVSNMKHDFVKLGYSDFYYTNQRGFFEIVDNLMKTNYLIKKVSKYIFDPNKSKGTQAINNLQLEYKTKVQYNLKKDDGLYVPIHLNKKSISKAINLRNENILNFIKQNSLKYTKEEDVVRLINYYYSL